MERMYLPEINLMAARLGNLIYEHILPFLNSASSQKQNYIFKKIVPRLYLPSYHATQ